MIARLDDSLDTAAGIENNEVILGGDVTTARVRGVLEYRKRFNNTAAAFARAWGGYDFRTRTPEVGAMVGIRWEW